MRFVFCVSSVLHQNPIRGQLQIFDDGVGLPRPLAGVPGFFAAAVAGANENRFATGAKGQFHVAITIANNERAAKVDVMLAHGALDHARCRLATIANVGGTVRAIVNGVDMGALRLKFALHALIHLLYERLRKIATGHAGLVGNDNHSQARIVQAADDWPRKRKHTKSVEMIQVTDLFGDGAIAVEENGGLAKEKIRQKPPPEGASAARLRPFPG